MSIITRVMVHLILIGKNSQSTFSSLPDPVAVLAMLTLGSKLATIQ